MPERFRTEWGGIEGTEWKIREYEEFRKIGFAATLKTSQGPPEGSP